MDRLARIFHKYRALRLPFQAVILVVAVIFISSSVFAFDLLLNPNTQSIPSTLTNGLVGHWKFDGNATDSSGYGNNATTSNATLVTDRLGNGNSAYSLTGASNSYINLPNPTPNFISSDNAAFSVSLWIRPTNVSTGFCRVILGNENYNTSGFRYCINSASRPEMWTTQSGGTFSVGSSTTLSINTWYHVVITYNGSGGTIYVNGSSTGTGSGTIKSNTNNVRVANGIGGVDYFAGSIDDVRFYNRAINTTEVTDLYNNNLSGTPGSSSSTTVNLGKGQAGLVGHWDLNGNAYDKSPYSNNGTVVGATPTTDRRGKSNSAYAFSGTGQYISAADNARYQFGTGDFTVSAWIKTSVTKDMTFVGKYTGNNSNFYLLAFNTTGKLQFVVASTELTSPASYNDGNWHHVAGVRVGGVGYLVVDGEIVAGGVGMAGQASGPGSPVRIGRLGTLTGYDFEGSIDDVRVYNRAISPEDVISLSQTHDASLKIGGVQDNVALSTNLVGRWPFTGNATDSTPYSNNGTVSGASLTTDRFGVASRAYSFNGTSNQISIPNPTPNFIASNNAPFSMSIWLKPSAYGSTRVIVGNESYGSSGFRYATSNTGNVIFWTIESGGNLDPGTFASSSALVTGSWYNVVITYNGSVFKMYINGSYNTASPTGRTINSNTNSLVLAGGVGGMNRFSGVMDDFRIWSRELSAVEVQAIYNGQ